MQKAAKQVQSKFSPTHEGTLLTEVIRSSREAHADRPQAESSYTVLKADEPVKSTERETASKARKVRAQHCDEQTSKITSKRAF